MKENQSTILTIGHSTRPIEVFIKILQSYNVTRVVDIRTIPRSRHNPQFNKEALTISLKGYNIGYTHMAGLGGLRHAKKDSPNTGWRNASFRGFADYMQTAEFETGLAELTSISQKERVVIMCAEAVPWRCHRSLIADALLVRGINVEHIISLESCRVHTLTPWAKVNGIHITYPPEAASK